MKAMKLYDGVNRIYRELEALGLGADAPLRVSDLTPFDQYHYHGTKAVDEAIAAAQISSGMRVLDVGAGIGGPARYLAEMTGAHVTALELQHDLNDTGADLTGRCGLSARVAHVCGNVLDGLEERYDAMLSLLCFLHIADRATLFRNCRAALKAGGALYIEDYGLRRALSVDEMESLAVKVQCPFLPTVEDYRDDLRQAGFNHVDVVDVTEDWKTFTSARLSAFRAGRARHVALHGEALVAGLDDFYATVARLFAGGAISGLKIVAR
jgi:cyclopropane fatty-acyl-phospholipid synthase-like methyltransferase